MTPCTCSTHVRFDEKPTHDNSETDGEQQQNSGLAHFQQALALQDAMDIP